MMNVTKMLSYCRGTVQRTLSVEILSNAAQLRKKSHLKRLAVHETLEFTQSHWNCR